MSGSHVSIAQRHCPICGKTFETGEILLDKKLRESMERHTVVGYGICEACTEDNTKWYVLEVDGDEFTGRYVQCLQECNPNPDNKMMLATLDVFSEILEQGKRV